MRTFLLAAALSLVSTTAQAAPACAFFSTFGDNTQVDDGTASVDDAAAPLYAMPATFLNIAQWQWGNGMAHTDQIVVDAAHPIVLQGYTPFDYETTEYAFLRFDIYWSTYSNTEAFATIDDTFTQYLLTWSYYDALTDRLQKFGVKKPEWVSIRLDLLSGVAYAASIDAYGNPLVDYGAFTKFGAAPGDSGQLYYVLKDASDGTLYAELYDDMPLSYVALYGAADGNGCP
jgi:hypothetical protein